MSDYIEHSCPRCGSLLHYEDKCPTTPQDPLSDEALRNYAALFATPLQIDGVAHALRSIRDQAIEAGAKRERARWEGHADELIARHNKRHARAVQSGDYESAKRIAKFCPGIEALLCKALDGTAPPDAGERGGEHE